MHSPGKPVDFFGVKKGIELRGEARGGVETGQFSGYGVEGVLLNPLTAEVPDDGAELWFDAEGEAVIDSPDLATGILYAMAALPVSIVD